MPYRPSDVPMLTQPVEPLTRTNAQGSRYERLPTIETELEDLLALPTRTAQENRIAVWVAEAPGYTHPESVAYFVRECRRRNDRGAESWNAENWLAARVLERCDAFLQRHLRGLNETHYEAARDRVVEQLFREMRDLTHTGGEFYQVRFWQILTRRCTSVYRHYAGKSRWETRHIARPTIGADNGIEHDPLDTVADSAPLPDTLPGDGNRVERGLRYLREHGLERDAEARQKRCDAFALRYLEGYAIGDQGEVGTIAGTYGVSARTINNWLNEVKNALAAWLQEDAA